MIDISFARAVGTVVGQMSAEKEAELQKVLGIAESEFKKLYRGRLLLSVTDHVKVAEVCNLTLEDFVDSILHQYGAQDERREFILDLIDAYIDAKEILLKAS